MSGTWPRVPTVGTRADGGQALLDLAARGFATGMSWFEVVGAAALALCATFSLTILRHATATEEENEDGSVAA